jgi:hypothetical protein
MAALVVVISGGVMDVANPKGICLGEHFVFAIVFPVHVFGLLLPKNLGS